MAAGFGFPKYPQQKSPNPKMVGEMLARAGGHVPPVQGAQLPGIPGHPHHTNLKASASGLPVEPVASSVQSPILGLRK